jgi:hypothetical protein
MFFDLLLEFFNLEVRQAVSGNDCDDRADRRPRKADNSY